METIRTGGRLLRQHHIGLWRAFRVVDLFGLLRSRQHHLASRTRRIAMNAEKHQELRVRLLTALLWVLCVTTLLGQAARAQDKLVAPLGFEVISAGRATTSSANEETPAAPFVGLASPITVDPLFATANLTIGIEVPPGRKGLTPDLTLRYSSNAGNGPFGVGWNLPLGSVRRNAAQGVPLNYSSGLYADSPAGFQLVFRGGTILLDTCVNPTAGCTSWAASAEEVWLSASFNKASNRWQIRDKGGLTSTYGAVREARTGNGVDSADSTFAWYLTDVQDPNGNAIQIQYRNVVSATGQNAHADPLQIDYGGNTSAGLPHVLHVVVGYDDQRPDIVMTYRGGFAEQVSGRVTSITVSVDGAATNPTREYQFTYEQDPDTHLSLLTAVHLEVPGETSPPDTKFSYETAQHLLEAAVPLNFLGANTPPSALASVQTDSANCLNCSPVPISVRSAFADVNGDGRKDYLDGTDGPGLPIFRNAPGASGSAPSFQSNGTFTAQGTYLADDNHLLIDMTGDGLPDMVTANTPDCVSPGAATTCAWQVAVNGGGDLSGATPWPGVPTDLGGFIPRPLPRAGTQPAQLIDLNGDLRADILDCNGWSTATPSCSFYRNNGGGFDSGVPWGVPDSANANALPGGGQSYTKSPLAAVRNYYVYYLWTTKRLIDLNGDGLPDLVSSESFVAGAHWDVWLNTGHGFGPGVVSWPAPSPSFLGFDAGVVELRQDGNNTIEQWSYVTTAALRDMNGDGLADYVSAGGSLEIPTHSINPNAIDRVPGPWTVFLNTGQAFESGTPWGNTDGATLADNWYGYGYALGWTNNNNDVFDVDGDGIADNVFRTRNGSAPFSAALGAGPRPNLLFKEENGLGASWVATYAPYSGGANAVPFPMWTVAKVSSHSGFSGPGNDSTTEFAFTGGSFDPVSHELRGFDSSVEARQADGRVINRSFAPVPNPPPSSGFPGRPFKLAGEAVYDKSGSLLQSTSIQWGSEDLGGGRVQVHPTQRIDRTYSTTADPPQTRTQTFDSYNALNDVTSETVSGDGVPAAITTTREDWYQSCTGLGCLGLLCPGRPTKTVVTSAAVALSEQDFTYDTRCNLTSTQARLAFSGQSAMSGQLITTTTLEYDRSAQSPDQAAAKAGLPTTIIDARDQVTTLQYGCSNRLYPCTITSALSQTTTAAWDLRWGKPTSLTDPNNTPANPTTTTFAYDGLGRLTTISRPLDSASLPWRLFTYQFGAAPASPFDPPVPSRVQTRVREPNAVAYRTISTFYDGWGRALETKQEQNVDGFPTVAAQDAVTFDNVGRIAKRYPPWAPLSEDLTQYDAPKSTARGTTFLYDALDRLTRITNPSRTYRTLHYSVAGQTTIQDENYNRGKYPGSRTVEKRDMLGRTVTTEAYAKDPGQSEVLVTRTTNDYDGLGRVKRIITTDVPRDVSAVTSFDYDSFGRRTQMTDADSAVWQYGYDEAGNLVYQNDPKGGQHVAFCYDALNRVSRKAYLLGDLPLDSGAHAVLCALPSVSSVPYTDYRYDCGSDGVGRLCGVDEYQSDANTNAIINTAYGYDARGRITTETKMIELGNFARSESYTRTYSYDEADRMVSVTYPKDMSGQGEALSYLYDNLGQLAAVETSSQTYATGLTYDLFGRLTLWEDGSGLLHATTYEKGTRNFRLKRLRVTNPQPLGISGIYQRLDYRAYDDAGNLTKLKDRAPKVKHSWRYQYDGLGRLNLAKDASTAAVPFAYDGLGNMTQNNYTHFEHADPAHPHRMTTVSDGLTSGSAAYDSNGALTSAPRMSTTLGRTITYDHDGRVAQVSTDDGHTVGSIYDFTGERVARIADEGQANQALTFYFGRWFEVAEFGPSATSTTLTRHIYLGDQLIAESPVTGVLGPGASPPLFFVHADHLGSTMMLTCFNQGSSCPDRSIARYYRYDAYGAPQAYAADGSPLPTSTPLPGNYRPEILYTGQRWDAPAQLHYYGARFYDPKIATFLTLDPVQEYMSPYAYLQWNPTNRIDPTGAQDCDFDVCFSVSGGFPSDPFSGVGSPSDPWFGANDPASGFRFGGGFDVGFSGSASAGLYSSSRLDFTIPEVTGLGTIGGALFIQAKSESIVGSFRLTGDARQPNPFLDTAHSRAFFTLNYEQGQGVFQVNPTCTTFGLCASALPINDPYSFRGNTVRIATTAGGSVAIDFALNNSITRFPAINGSVTFAPRLGGDIAVSGWRDQFPSFEVYHYYRGVTVDLINQTEVNPLYLLPWYRKARLP